MKRFLKEKFYVLTTKGHQIYDAILLDLSDLEKRVVSSFGEKEIDTLTRLLKKFDQTLEKTMK